ncbi:PHD finger protein 11-like isoform X2 [Meriones unguiculatus]|uniref:PHD finger protein 11-like isoform X2 n=1 Tax=Meriones unguiculatus TaxID=10047 RepID=UPI00293E6D50|nr:PHD finger protein 11-like isoform X2 [Meriones unguiculatus]
MAQEISASDGPVPNGVSQVTEKMEKWTCALCPEGHEWSVIYIAPSEKIAAHENCLKCSLCKKKGATVGCDVASCAKKYHLLCGKKDKAVLQVDGVHGTYKLFCEQHAPEQEEPAPSTYYPRVKRKKGRKKRFLSGAPAQPTKMKFGGSKIYITEKLLSTTGEIFRVPFLKKCKEAGLLNELFEGILGKIDSIHGRLIDERASESEYEEFATLLFTSRLFEDTLIKFQEVIRNKAYEHEERQRHLKQQLEALIDLKETFCSFQENVDQDHSSSTSRSLEDHQFKWQEFAEMSAGSSDSL